MKRIRIELDDRTLALLRRVAPGADERSAFIREAIRRALNERLEADMEDAYLAVPPTAEDVELDPSTWQRRP